MLMPDAADFVFFALFFSLMMLAAVTLIRCRRY